MQYFLLGLLAGGTLKVYSDSLKEKRHIIDKNKVRRLSKLNINKVPFVDVKEKYESQIQNFVIGIKENLPFVDLTNFNRNIEELKIRNYEFISNVAGDFDPENIVIRLSNEDVDNSLTHELLHLASSIYTGDIGYIGFSQQFDDFRFGDGLNEGYTSVLDNRYFNKNKSYLPIRAIVEAIEKIVGKDNMTKKYFEADLQGLINDLSKYCLEGKVYKLIKNIDFMLEAYSDFNKFDSSKKELLQEKVDEIILILFECYANKLEIGINYGIVDNYEAVIIFEEFCNDLMVSYTIKKDMFCHFLTQELYDVVYDQNIHKLIDEKTKSIIN